MILTTPRAWTIAIAIAVAACRTPDLGDTTQTLAGDAGAADAPDAGDLGTIAIAPTAITIVGPSGQQATAAFSVAGLGASDQLAAIAWLGDPGTVSSVTPPCVSGTCPLAPTIDLPAVGQLACTPGQSATTATLQVISNTGVTASAQVTCAPPGSGPSFAIPSTVGPVVADVDSSAGGALHVTNTGDQPIAISARLDALDDDSAAWQIGRCAAPDTCLLDAGETLDIPVTLHPDRHGTFDTAIEVTGPPAVETRTATLLGLGLGGVLHVDRPADPFVLDFGTIAKDQTVTLAVAMTDTGNQDITVTPSDPGAPFAVVPDPVTVTGDGGIASFDVACNSAAPLPLTTSTVDLDLSQNAYDRNTDQVKVRCAIVDATVQVTNPLDFGELRTGDPEGVLEVAIANPPGGGDVDITRVELVGAPAGVTLDPITLPQAVADDDQLAATLHLATGADVTLDGVVLEVDVDEGTTATLKVPVTGKVGTPAAVVLPTDIDLGTICVGAPVAADATLTNTGTATLNVQRPTIDSPSYAALFQRPTAYPAAGAPLAPTDKAQVGVVATATEPGKLEGTLTWPVDVPDGGFEIPLSLELLAEGTAVSPARLSFGTADITDPPTAAQTITLQNCGSKLASIEYSGTVTASGTSDAWLVDPPELQRTLLPGERARIRVAFSPTEPGRHEASLPIKIDDDERTVRLEGDATGTLPDRSSFYGCGGCVAPGVPAGGWPIIGAVLLAIRRRRARSSDRCPSGSS